MGARLLGKKRKTKAAILSQTGAGRYSGVGIPGPAERVPPVKHGGRFAVKCRYGGPYPQRIY